ncbi:MAG: hypothetical protein AAB966_00715 [Patescibacteria group bacterium]
MKSAIKTPTAKMKKQIAAVMAAVCQVTIPYHQKVPRITHRHRKIGTKIYDKIVGTR